jgi:ribosomal protein L40E
MSIFDNIIKIVTDTAKVATKKSGELVEVTRLNMNISAEQDKIDKICLSIGKTIYEAFKKGERAPDNFIESCKDATEHEENIKNIKQKILELKNLKICAECGAELDADTAYCSKCGAKQ